MPYRRLPTTDQARLRAMERALANHSDPKKQEPVLSESLLFSLSNFLPRFQNALLHCNIARDTQAKRGREYAELVRKARLYLSHYIQVMNMAIARGELKPEIRKFYQLADDEKSIPNLVSEASLVEWGKKIIEGDQKRIMKGGNPIYNPSIALVKVNFEKFYDAHKSQKILQANTDRNLKLVAGLRNEADALIVKAWNEIEAHYSELSEQEKRERSKEHGVVYVLRKSELKAVTVVEEENQPELPLKVPATTKRILPRELEEIHIHSTEGQLALHKKNVYLQSVIPF